MNSRIKNGLLLVIVLFIANISFSQMRQVHLDQLQPDNEVYKFSFYSPSTGFVGFRDWVGFTSDTGHTFVKKYITLSNVDYNGYGVNLTFGFGINGLKAFNQDTIIVYGDYGLVPSILYSTNGGNSFKLVYHSQYNSFQLSGGVTDMVFPQNNSTGFAIDADRILKTTNKGLTWTTIYTSPSSFFDYLEAVDNNTVLAMSTGYNTNKLLKTTNSGSTWTQLPLPSFLNQGKMNYAYFITASKGYLNMYDYDNASYIFYTSNGGFSWTLKNNGEFSPFGCSKMKFVNDSTGYAITGLFNVYKTSDSGKVWEEVPADNQFTYLGYSHNDLYCWSSNQLIAGGGHGFIELNTNPGAPTIPRALFKIDTTGSYINNTVNLINFSKPGYSFQWIVNGTQVGTGYHASYTHNIYNVYDTVSLIVSNGSMTDTLERIQQMGAIPPPDITSFTPTSGTMGSVITISGNYFYNASAVTFGGVPASSFTVLSPTTIQAEVNTGLSGFIKVTTPGGTDSISGFTFIPPPPTISSFTPTAAIAGTEITINGMFFSNASAISFGGVPAASFTVVSQTQVKAIVATGASGLVSVTTPTGTGTASGFSFIPPVSFTSFTPASGPAGTTVTITGNNFNPVPANNHVYFGGMKATVLTASATTLTATVPLGATYSPISISVNQQTVFSSLPFMITFPNGGNISNTSFQNVGTYSVWSQSTDINYGCVGDIDGDGKLDVVTGNTNSLPSVSVFRNTSSSGNITFAPRLDLFSGQFIVITNELRDMNMDGKLDLVMGTGNVRIAKNTSTVGNISFDNPLVVQMAGSHHGMAIADIDGDGRPDMALSNMFDDKVTVLRNTSNNGILSFAPKMEFAAGDDPWGTALADLDGDGKPEMIVPNYYDGNVSVYHNLSTPGNIVFAPRVNFPALGPRGLAAGDIDGDGKTDLAIAHISGNGGVVVLRNTSSGIGNISFAPLYNAPGWDNFSVQLADMDGDGKLDMVTPNQADQSTSIYKNTGTVGNISFAPKVNFTTAPNAYPRSAPVGDLDNDGKNDFVFINYNLETITIFRNRINESLANAGIDLTNCAGSPVAIGSSALTGNTYNWSSSPAGFSSTSPNPTVSPLVSTTYYLEVVNSGNTYHDTVHVTVIPAAVANAGANQTICSSTAVTLGTPALAGYTYSWTSAPSGFTSSQAQPVVTPTGSGSYYLTAIAPNGCIAKDTVVVLLNPVAYVDISATSTFICSGALVTFTATPYNGGSNPSYQWKVNGINVGSNSNSFSTNTLTNAAQVSVVMTPSGSCTGATATSNTITVYVTGNASNAGPDKMICTGQGTTIGTPAMSGYFYSWSPSTGLSAANIAQPVASPASTTVYVLTSTNGSCNSTDTVIVQVASPPPAPSILLAGNTLISSSVSGNQWYKNNILIPGAIAQSYVASSAGVYTVSVTVNGCSVNSSNSINFIPTAINDPVLGAKLVIAPNPVQHFLEIHFPGNMARMEVRLLDINGKTILSGTDFTTSHRIDMSRFSAGQYIIQVINRRTGQQAQRMIIRQ